MVERTLDYHVGKPPWRELAIIVAAFGSIGLYHFGFLRGKNVGGNESALLQEPARIERRVEAIESTPNEREYGDEEITKIIQGAYKRAARFNTSETFPGHDRVTDKGERRELLDKLGFKDFVLDDNETISLDINPDDKKSVFVNLKNGDYGGRFMKMENGKPRRGTVGIIPLGAVENYANGK